MLEVRILSEAPMNEELEQELEKLEKEFWEWFDTLPIERKTKFWYWTDDLARYFFICHKEWENKES
jgi:hypothetical protein